MMHIIPANLLISLLLTLASTMPPADTADEEGYTSSTQWSNDRKGIDVHTPFLTAKLSDKEEGGAAYRSFRTKVIKRLIETGPNMWDQALECAERATGASITITVFDIKYRVRSDDMK